MTGPATNDPQTAAVIAERFALPAPADSVEPYGKGLINTTFLVIAGGVGYILQRINDTVFPAPQRIMDNLAVLEGHLAARADSRLRIPSLIPSRDGPMFIRAEDGGIWRLMEFIADAEGLAQISDLDQATEVGRILGRFHADTRDLPPHRLAVTLPGFHVTPGYLERFQQVLVDHTGAFPFQARQAVDFVAARRDGAGVLEDARRAGHLPERVIHGDPKLDNILFDRSRERAVSLIDLDTVQPGLALYDLGDCLRSCCNRRGESAAVVGCAADTEPRADFDLDICHAILAAYAQETRGLLLQGEIELLFQAIRLIPFELGLRFLTDHLEGDRYFRVTVPGRNLHKARVQFGLVEDIEAKEREIRRIIDACFGLDEPR